MSGRFRVYQRGLVFRPFDNIVYLDEVERYHFIFPGFGWRRIAWRLPAEEEFVLLDAVDGAEVARSTKTVTRGLVRKKLERLRVATPEGEELFALACRRPGYPGFVSMLGETFAATEITSVGDGKAKGTLYFPRFSVAIEQVPYGFRFVLSKEEGLLPCLIYLFLFLT